MLEKAIDEYCNHFDVDGFPLMYFMGCSTDDIIKTIDDCIKTNTEYTPPEDDCDY